MTEEKINANYMLFIKYLGKYGCYSEDMMTELGEKIKIAPYHRQECFGGAETGSMIDITLNKLCKIGAQLNNNTLGTNNGEKIQHPHLCVNNNMLMRVLLLSNIAKSVIFEPTTEQWKRNRGINYEFVENGTKMKLGQYSLFLCQKYGIKLELEEFDAFTSMDSEDENGECFMSPLYAIVKIAKTLTSVELRQEYLAKIEKSKFEQEK